MRSLLGVVIAVAVAAASWSTEASPYRETVLLSLGQTWLVWDASEPPPSGWQTRDFPAVDWQESDGPPALVADPTRVPGGRIGRVLRPGGDTIYARTTFPTPPDLNTTDARLVFDFLAKDGAVFYLNGIEIGRSPTMPEGEVEHNSRAERSPRLRVKTGFFVNPALLQPGHNVLAASLHSHIDEENPEQRALAAELLLVEGMSARPATTRPRHVRVTWVENPQHEAMVSWTTDAPAGRHLLHLDTVTRNNRAGAYAQTLPPSHSGEYSLSRADVRHGVRPGYYAHVHLRALQPDTTYYLRAESDGETSAEFHFTTAPADDRPIKVLFGGDSRIGGGVPYQHHHRRSMNRRMAALTEEFPAIRALVHGGDFTQLAKWRFIEPWLTDHELTRTQDGRIIPVVPIRGNHDLDVGWEEVFWWPGQKGRYYYETALTPRTRLVVLNTEISLGGAQRQWLRQTLARSRAESRWLLAAYHRPAWPSVRGFEDGANRRRFWVPHFEEYRIDLALESHDHALKRTVPILQDAQHEHGIVYIGDGGLGVPQRTPDPTRWYLQGDQAMSMSVHHVHILDFTDEHLRGTAYGMGGEVLDEFTRPLRRDHAWTGEPPPAEAAVD